MTYADREKIERLKAVFDTNYRVSNLYSLYLERCPEIISKEMMDTLMNGAEFSKEDAIIALLVEIFSLDETNKDDKNIIKNYLRNSVKILDPKKYTENPYYKNIKIDNARLDGWEFRLESYLPYRAVVAGDMRIYEDFSEVAPLGFFEDEFHFPAVLENGNEWMTLTPVDIDTCDVAIEKAFGKVITFGLGLGYYAYMVSQKDSVDSITVIEKSEKIIKLFCEYILPQFPNKDKVKIINADAFEYAKREMPSENFDYAFVDTWRDASDGAPMYKKMKALEKLSPSTKFDYWVEGFLVSRLRALKFEKCLQNLEKYASYKDFINELSWENVWNG